MSRRRGPWLSGLIVALIGAMWMVGQVIGGVVSMVGGLVPAEPTAVVPVATVG